jgi:IS30 family transposase
MKIAKVLGRHKLRISQENRRNFGLYGYRPKTAREMARKRSAGNRIAHTIDSWVKEQGTELINLQWSTEQIAQKLPVSHKTLYQHVYTSKCQSGDWQQPQTGHPDGTGAQKRICSHSEGFKQYIRAGGLYEQQSAQSFQGQGKNPDL